jgi:hypothetical protein
MPANYLTSLPLRQYCSRSQRGRTALQSLTLTGALQAIAAWHFYSPFFYCAALQQLHAYANTLSGCFAAPNHRNASPAATRIQSCLQDCCRQPIGASERARLFAWVQGHAVPVALSLGQVDQGLSGQTRGDRDWHGSPRTDHTGAGPLWARVLQASRD